MGSELRIGHYHPVWLPNTMTWLYRQISELENNSRNSVYCEHLDNLDQFPFTSVYAFENEPFFKRLSDRVLKKIGSTSGLRSLVSKMKSDHIDLLHSHFGHVGVTGTKMAEELGVPSVVTFYGMDLFQVPKRYPTLGAQYPEMFNKVSMILCEGTQMAESVISMGADASKVMVHPLGIELDTIDYIPRTWNQDEPLKVLLAASFRPKKGIPNAIKALSELSKTIDLEVTIVGDSTIDQVSILEKDRIFCTTRESDIHDKIHFLGFRTHQELLEIAKGHHLFLQPSQHADDGDCEGGVPVTLIELAAQGLQIVSTYHCDIPSVIEHGKTGWLCPEKDTYELIRVLFEAIENATNWGDISLRSRKHIESRYDAKKQAATLLELYKGVLHG
jgi:colanic acid/amylovoran biosynthesis glycosyltransferase